MTNSQEQLLALVQLAIHPKDKMPIVLENNAIDWEDLLNESKKQSLIGIAYAGIRVWSNSDVAPKTSNPVDKILLTKWHGLAEKIHQDNLIVNKRTVQVCRNFAKEGFRTSVMKGQGNSRLYDADLSLFRASGDIDVWVDGGFQRVYDYVQKVAPTKKVSEKEIVFDVFGDVEVEVHYRPFIMRNPFRNRRLQKFFDSQSEACFNNFVQFQTINKEGVVTDGDAFVTTIPFNLVHQLAHIHRHLFAVGVGLRHLMDYYYQLIHAEKILSQTEKEEVISVVRSIGLERLAKALIWILTEYFSMPEKCQLWEPNAKDGRFLLEDILRTGNFGHGDESLTKGMHGGSLVSYTDVLKHNLSMSRFDHTDWFWGPLSRIHYFFWRKRNGFIA